MLELLKQVVSSDAFVQVVVAVVAAVWALPRISAWRQDVASSKWSKLYTLAENAVMQTWNAYTAQLKAGKADASAGSGQAGKLTAQEAATARAQAVSTLRDLAAKELPGVIETYGQDALSALVALVHGRLQKEGAIG